MSIASGRAKSSRVAPSLAGTCLRYAVMDYLGFPRHIDPESRQAMQEGVSWHGVFQSGMLDRYAMAHKEVSLKNDEWGVRGRMDVVIDTPLGPWAIEYKTTSRPRFETIREKGPLVSHWAQLQLYVVLAPMRGGSLVVDNRDSHERLVFHCAPDPDWALWLKHRVGDIVRYGTAKKLPAREVSRSCLHCDRWFQCFPSDQARQAQAEDHPVWEPTPPYPAIMTLDKPDDELDIS